MPCTRIQKKAIGECGQTWYGHRMEEPIGSDSEPRRPCGFLELFFSGWEPLGGDCALTLMPDRTVFVGHNGGGKSLLLESLLLATQCVAGVRPLVGPPRFSARVGTHEFEEVTYKYEYSRNPSERRTLHRSTTLSQYQWQEQGSIGDSLWDWDVQKGVLRTPHNSPIQLPPDIGIIQTDIIGYKYGTSVARFALADFARRMINVVLKRARFPRIDLERGPIYIEDDEALRGSPVSYGSHVDRYLYTLGEKIIEIRLGDGDTNGGEHRFEELVEVGRRIGAWRQIIVQVFKNTLGRESRIVRTLEIDGINFGYASDGTLRILDLLADLIVGTSESTILIDEPELGIHPGMLGRLLAEFDTYGQEKQIVIATHSPQVVSWAKPDQLRIVERADGKTCVGKVSEEQASRIASFLQDQGTLGEFTFGGGLDD